MCVCVCVCVTVCSTHRVRSLGMWLKLDRGMRVMLLLLRVLDAETEEGKREKQIVRKIKQRCHLLVWWFKL